MPVPDSAPASFRQAHPRIGILALQGDFAAHAAALREAGAEPVLVRTPAELSGLAALVLPGGESTTFLELLDRGGLLQPLRDFLQKKPAFGTCAGCILLAKQVSHPAQKSLEVLDISVERNAYGRQTDSSIEVAPTSLPGGPLEMVYIRAPRISAVAKDIEVLAKRDGFPVLIRQGRSLAATFHPELSADRRVHRLFVDLVKETINNSR